MYFIIVCYNCGHLLLTESKYRTRMCPDCRTRLLVARTKHVSSAKSAKKASELIRVIKQKKKAYP